MLCSTLRLLLLLACLRSTQAGVETLDVGSFDATVSSSDLWLIKFYAPWCRQQPPAESELANHTSLAP